MGDPARAGRHLSVASTSEQMGESSSQRTPRPPPTCQDGSDQPSGGAGRRAERDQLGANIPETLAATASHDTDLVYRSVDMQYFVVDMWSVGFFTYFHLDNKFKGSVRSDHEVDDISVGNLTSFFTFLSLF